MKESTIKLLSQAHYNEYDRNLNNMHAKDLIDRFAINLQNEIDS